MKILTNSELEIALNFYKWLALKSIRCLNPYYMWRQIIKFNNITKVAHNNEEIN